jgi:hypothetical protein
VELLPGQRPNVVPNQAKDLMRSLYFINPTKYSLVLIDGLLSNTGLLGSGGAIPSFALSYTLYLSITAS